MLILNFTDGLTICLRYYMEKIVIIKSLSGETTLACILPVPLSLGRNQCHVLAHYDVDVQKLSEIYIVFVVYIVVFFQ